MNKWVKALLITAAVVIGWLLFVLYILSPIGRVVVTKNAPQWIGRKVEMSSLRINPYTGSVRIKDFEIKEQTEDSTFVSFNELYVRISLPKLISQKVHLRHIWLTDFSASVIQQDTTFNFTDIIERFKKPENPDEIVQDTTPGNWKVLLDDIRLHGGIVRYEDQPHERAWAIENINIDIPGLHFDNRQTDAGLSLNLPDNGGNLLLQGAYNMAQGAYALNINMTDIDLNQTLPLVQDYMNIKQLDALLSGHLKANGRLDDAANIHIAGYLSVDGIDIRDADRQTFLAAEHIGIKIEQFNPKNMLMRFDSILVDSLHLNYIKTKNYDTFSRLMKSSEKQKTQTIDENEDIMLEAEELESDSSISVPQKKNNLPDLFIKQLSLRSSDIHYEDRTLPSRFKYDISHVSVRSENFNMRGKQNHLLINAHLPNGGSVMANWKGGIDPERDNIKVVAMLRNVQLRDLSPYMEYMFAYPVNSGSLSVTSDNTFISGRLEGTTKLDILDLKLGRKKHIDAQLKRVPLKTAIELLTDLNGKISLSIPLFGNVNNPKFSLRKVVMGTLGNVLLKATATPFAAMARSKNIKIDDLSLLEIDMLTPDFTLEQYQKIDLLAEMMNEKQEINLQMVQQFNLQKAMAELAVFNLKRDYYLQEHPSIDGTKRLSLVEIEKVRSIKDGDAGFTAYYKSVCAGKGKLSDRALNYYTPDSVKTEVLRKAQIRNNILTRYLTQQKNINKKRVSIRTADDATLVVYKGKEKYSIESTLE